MIKFELNESNKLILNTNWKVPKDLQNFLSNIEEFYKKDYWNNFLSKLNEDVSTLSINQIKPNIEHRMKKFSIDLWNKVFWE